LVGLAEHSEKPIGESRRELRRGSVRRGEHSAKGERVTVRAKLDAKVVEARRGAVFGGEAKLIVLAAQQNTGVGPSEEFRGAPQGLTSAQAAGVLACVVDEQNAAAQAALKVSQVVEHRNDLGDIILIARMQSNERVEHEQLRLDRLDGLEKLGSVVFDVQAELRDGDDEDLELVEVVTGGTCNAVESFADEAEGIFGSKEQNAAGLQRTEAAQAGRSGGDAHDHVEGTETLTAFGGSTDDANSLIGPEAFDEPAVVVASGLELMSTANRQSHARRSLGCERPGRALSA
jgi:hypothetical protein